MEEVPIGCEWWTPTFPAYESYEEIAEHQWEPAFPTYKSYEEIAARQWEPALPTYESYEDIAEHQWEPAFPTYESYEEIAARQWEPTLPTYESYEEIAERQRKSSAPAARPAGPMQRDHIKSAMGNYRHRVEYTKGLPKANVDVKVGEATNTSVEQLLRDAEKRVREFEERIWGFEKRVDGVAERAGERVERTREQGEKIKEMEEWGRLLKEKEKRLWDFEERVWVDIREMEEKERERDIAEVTKNVEDMAFEEEMYEKTRRIAHLLESMDRDEAKLKLENLPVALNQLDPTTRKVIQEFKNKLRAYDMRRKRDPSYRSRSASPAPESVIREEDSEEESVFGDQLEYFFTDLPVLEPVVEGFRDFELESQSEEQSDEEWDKVSQDESDGEWWEEVKA